MTVCTDCPCLNMYNCNLGYDVAEGPSFQPVSHNCRLIKVETIDSAFYPDKRMGGEYEEDCG